MIFIHKSFISIHLSDCVYKTRTCMYVCMYAYVFLSVLYVRVCDVCVRACACLCHNSLTYNRLNSSCQTDRCLQVCEHKTCSCSSHVNQVMQHTRYVYHKAHASRPMFTVVGKHWVVIGNCSPTHIKTQTGQILLI